MKGQLSRAQATPATTDPLRGSGPHATGPPPPAAYREIRSGPNVPEHEPIYGPPSHSIVEPTTRFLQPRGYPLGSLTGPGVPGIFLAGRTTPPPRSPEPRFPELASPTYVHEPRAQPPSSYVRQSAGGSHRSSSTGLATHTQLPPLRTDTAHGRINYPSSGAASSPSVPQALSPPFTLEPRPQWSAQSSSSAPVRPSTSMGYRPYSPASGAFENFLFEFLDK